MPNRRPSTLSEWWNSGMPGRGGVRFLLVVFAAAMLVLSGCASNQGAVGSRDKDQAVEDHVKLGLSYLREGNRQAARRHLSRAMEIDGRSARAYHGMALLLQVELEYELAEEHYRKALSYDRDYTRARNNYAVFLYDRERYEEAYRQFKEAGEDIDYRNRSQVFFSLGVVANRLGRQEEARQAWEKALALAPRYGLPHLELAEYHFGQGNFDMARKHLRAFDTLEQPQSRSLWLAVRLAEQRGDRDTVASKGLALTKLFPNSDETRQYEAWLNNEQNNR